MSFGKPHRAVFCSGIVVLASLALFVSLYQKLLVQQRPPEAVSNLRYGKHGYLLASPDGDCYGWVRYELEYDGSYSFLVSGDLRYSLDGEPSDFLFSAGAGFNSLNQLSATYVRIQHDGEEYVMGTDGVTPIKLSFEGSIRGKRMKLAHSIRGPIEIYEPTEGKFLIRSEDFPKFEQLTKSFHNSVPIQPNLPVKLQEQKVHEKEALQKICSQDQQKALQLDDFHTLFMRVSSMVFS